MNTVTAVLHELTHRVPGVPEHPHAVDGSREVPGVQAPTRAQRHAHEGGHVRRHQGRALRNRNRHHQDPPRVLVAWQNRIAHLVHADR